MTEPDRLDVDLPSKWHVEHPDGQPDSVARLHLRTATGTTFVVAVVPDPSDGASYRLRLSTETPTNVRHDYPVGEYESREAAVSAARSFVEHLTRRLRQDRLAASDPSIEAVRQTIQSFRDDSLLASLHRTLRGLR
jgi:hypothetical protein